MQPPHTPPPHTFSPLHPHAPAFDCSGSPLIAAADMTMTLHAGGLKATFTSSYIHTVIIYVTLILFCVTVYGTSPKLGSPSVVWEHLTAMQHANPASGNRDGSYMTILSANGLMFGLIQA